MTYPNTFQGTFLSRPNRFLAEVMMGGTPVAAHVKTPGDARNSSFPVQG